MKAPIATWRIGLGELSRWACNYDKIGKNHPTYRIVVENRDRQQDWKYYSSCADLGHFLAQRAGVEQKWVNRDTDDINGPWEIAKNVGKLDIAATDIPEGYDATQSEGDIWIVSNTWYHPDPKRRGTDAHVLVDLGPNPAKPGEILTANYGASGLTPIEFPGGQISSKPFTSPGGKHYYGSKMLVQVLAVPNLVSRVTRRPDFSGPAFTARWIGEMQDELERHLDA